MLQLEDFLVCSMEDPGPVGSSHGNISRDNYGAATIILHMPGEKGLSFWDGHK